MPCGIDRPFGEKGRNERRNLGKELKAALKVPRSAEISVQRCKSHRPEEQWTCLVDSTKKTFCSPRMARQAEKVERSPLVDTHGVRPNE